MKRASKGRAWILVATAWVGLGAQEPPAGRATIEVEPKEATVGDPLRTTLTLELRPGFKFEPRDLGESFGELSVLSGSWQGPEETAGAVRYRWTGMLAAYKVGSFEVPALAFQLQGQGGPAILRTERVPVTIRSVLAEAPEEEEEEGKETEISDLKAPTSVAPNFGPLRKAAAALAALLLASGVAWWLHRRYAARLAAVPAPEDPFRRMPPHVWAYQELQHLLERRLAEEGKVDLFFSELSRILKTYLGGRYRLELMEHTTAELVPLLRQTGAPAGALLESRALLERADLVKFARQAAVPEACRKAVEEAYRIVDSTKPAEEPTAGAA